MKTAKTFIKITALVLVFAMALAVLASCGKKNAVMTLEADGKTYTLSEAEYDTFMKIIKANFFISSGYSSSVDSIIWAISADEDGNETYDDHYTEYVKEIVKTALVEKYLFDKYGLKISDATIAGNKENVKKLNDGYGGRGAYKRYFGYTAQDYIDYYQMSTDRSDLIIKHLYKGENAVDPVTDADKKAVYDEKYEAYMFIYLDMNNKIEKDDDGNYIGVDSSNNKYILEIKKDEDGIVTIENKGRVDGTETDLTKVTITGFSMVKLTDEEINEKATLPDKIIKELDENGGDFKNIALEYSDEYTSFLFENGVVISDTGYFVANESVMKPSRELEIGEHTEPIAVSDSKYVYIVKKIEKPEKAYEEEEYKDLFTSFEDTVMYDKYQEILDEYLEKIVLDEKTLGNYKMSTTYLTPYVDYYKQQMAQYTGQ